MRLERFCLPVRLHLSNLRGRRTDGQGLAEYAMILALVAIFTIIALVFLGGQVSKILSAMGQSV
ncbi:MAG: Flp family type IVb pilin [Acidimicrobiales bacterium]